LKGTGRSAGGVSTLIVERTSSGRFGNHNPEGLEMSRPESAAAHGKPKKQDRGRDIPGNGCEKDDNACDQQPEGKQGLQPDRD
jgi:hypothetical protein